MTDDGLDDMQRYTSVGGKRNKCMPKRMKSSFRRFTAPPFQLNGCYDIGGYAISLAKIYQRLNSDLNAWFRFMSPLPLSSHRS